MASPFILSSRKILQDLCQERLQWDETVSEMYQKKWLCWKNDLIGLEKTELKRCIKPGSFNKIVHISLHSFPDASELGYWESSYLRLVDEYGHIHCTLMMAKVRVTPEHYPEILGRWCFKGIGKNVSMSWLSQCIKCIPNGGVHGALKLPGKVQGQNPWLGPGRKPQLSQEV